MDPNLSFVHDVTGIIYLRKMWIYLIYLNYWKNILRYMFVSFEYLSWTFLKLCTGLHLCGEHVSRFIIKSWQRNILKFLNYLVSSADNKAISYLPNALFFNIVFIWPQTLLFTLGWTLKSHEHLVFIYVNIIAIGSAVLLFTFWNTV